MPLNLDGIAQLKADLRANARHYNQQKFGIVTPECGTEACMAGMCRMREIGLEAFTKSIKPLDHEDFSDFVSDCVAAGAAQLGLTLLSPEDYGEGEIPPIFEAYHQWPEDLAEAFGDAMDKHNHAAMAEVACVALDRIDEHGCFVDSNLPASEFDDWGTEEDMA